MPEKIAIVDVDGVCADLLPAWLAWYNRDYRDTLQCEDITDWDLMKFVKPECGKDIFKYLDYPELYDDVEPIHGSIEGVKCLRGLGYKVVFATSSSQAHAGRKLTWLQEHGFITDEHMRYSFCDFYAEITDKSLLRGDIMIDDGLHNIEKFQGLPILFRCSQNASANWPVGFSTWAEIFQFLSQEHVPVGVHPTELKCPQQTREFKRIIDTMYTTHLYKNQDYSPANILATGHFGLVTRLWDKVARFSNLSGREVKIIDDSTIVEILFYNMIRLMWLTGIRVKMVLSPFSGKKEAKNEPTIDALVDQAVYSVIGQLLWKKVWGK